jgi:hypothetical protein
VLAAAANESVFDFGEVGKVIQGQNFVLCALYLVLCVFVRD